MADGPETEIHMNNIGRTSGPFRPVARETVHDWLGIRYFNGEGDGGGAGSGAGSSPTGASGGDAGGQPAGTTDPAPPQPGGQPSNGGGSGGQGGSGDGERKFSQADIDKAVQDRVNREKKKTEGETAKVTAAEQQKAAAEAAYQKVLDVIAEATGQKKSDTPPDPAELHRTIAEGTARNTALETENADLRVELDAWRIAFDAGANPVRLMNSRTFHDKLRALDRQADDRGKQIEALVKAEVDADESLKAPGQPRTPRPDPSQGAGRGPASTDAARGQEMARRRFGDRAVGLGHSNSSR